MTSPTSPLPSLDLAPPAAAGGTPAGALLQLLGQLSGSGGSASGSGRPAIDFSQLLARPGATSGTAANPAGPATAGPANLPTGTLATLLQSLLSPGRAATDAATESGKAEATADAPAKPAPSSAAVEEACALLLTLWPQLQSLLPSLAAGPAAGVAAADGAAAPAAAPGGDATAAKPAATATLVIDIPGCAELRQPLAAVMTRQGGGTAPANLQAPAAAGTPPAAPNPAPVVPPERMPPPPPAAPAAVASAAAPAANPEPVLELQLASGVTLRIETAPAAPGRPVPAAASPTSPMATAETGAAEFASRVPGAAQAGESGADSGKNEFLNAGPQQDTKGEGIAGIDVAKSDPAMPAKPFNPASLASDALRSAVLAVRSDVAPATTAGDTAAAVPAAATDFARSAVQTVVNVVDSQVAVQGHDLSSVNLRLNFEGQDLAIRVELRPDGVHTSFHTDSPELRTALSQQWQTSAVDDASRGLHFHEPQFAAADRAPGFTPNGQSSSDQSSRDPQQRSRLADESGAAVFGRSAASPAAAPAPAAVRAAPVRSAHTLHLSTFA